MKEMILILSLLGSNVAYSGIFGKKTEPVLRVLKNGQIVKVIKTKKSIQSIEPTGLNVHADSVAELIKYAEGMKNKKLSKRKKKALLISLLAEPID